MPIQVSAVAAGAGYASPVVGFLGHVLHKKIDLSGMTVDVGSGGEVDVDGYLRPGVVLKESGGLMVLVGAAAGVIYVVPEPTKLNVTTPVTAASLLLETGDHLVALAVAGIVNRDVAEDCMGRAYTANELTSFVTAGTLLAITTT